MNILTMHYFIFLLLLHQSLASEEGNLNKPNIIVLYIENLNQFIHLVGTSMNDQTFLPNMYKIINSSVHFHNVYGEVSSPSNFASMFTGKPAVDLGIIQGKILPFKSFPSLASTGGLKVDEVTIAEQLQSNRYRTWFTGYWKLGLGKNGEMFPTKHGFDTWMGVAHPHNEWCHRKKEGLLSSERISSHPYVALLYKTSFIWMFVLILLTILVWLRIISATLYKNLLIYTICTSVAFYVLLQFFIIQRSASCVLYYHESTYQQPYEQNNLTLHFTQHMSKLIDIVHESEHPFFAMLNYMKMKTPIYHSPFFRMKSTDSVTSALLELDWSIGVILEKLKNLNIYEDTTIILTGSTSCEYEEQQGEVDDSKFKVFQRIKANDFLNFKDSFTDWQKCFKVPLFIKDTSNPINATQNIYDIVSIKDVYDTILDISSSATSDKRKKASLRSFYKQDKMEYRSLTDYMFKVLTNLDDSNVTRSNEQDSYKQDWVIESYDDDAIIEALKSNNENEETVHDYMYQPNQLLFHYYNIYKPVMVTYKARYQVILKYLDSYGSLQTLSSILIIDLKHSTNSMLNQTQLSTHYEEVYQNVTAAWKLHALDRQNKNPWTSQFEMPVYPWLLPCANFPLCKTHDRSDEDDFSNVLKVKDVNT